MSASIRRRGFVKIGLVLFLASVCVVGSLTWILLAGSHKAPAQSLVMYCAAGVQKPVAEAVTDYLKELGVEVQVRYGPTGALLSQIQVARQDDLFLSADESYIAIAREKQLIDETLPLARTRPVIAVQKGNPKSIKSLDDLLKDDVKFALSDSSASIGKLTKELLTKDGTWDKFEQRSAVTAGTVNEAATKVALNAVDASIIWEANVRQDPKLEAIHVPLFDEAVQQVTIGVLKSTKQPADALRFARYLQAPEKGQTKFEKFGYETVSGDVWEKEPNLLIFSGGLNRVAIEKTILDFQKREGFPDDHPVDVVYNGCGLLVNMMKAGKIPDVYFACDTSYMGQVAGEFGPSELVSETDMVIITKKGNPKQIKSLKDLTNPELKVGAAHIYNSALGKLTKDLLESVGLYDAIKPQIKVDPATADLLVNELRAGPLDAAIVYRANVCKIPDLVEMIPITEGKATAVQPVAVAKNSPHRYLAMRFVEALKSAQSRQRFEDYAFRWRVGSEQP